MPPSLPHIHYPPVRHRSVPLPLPFISSNKILSGLLPHIPTTHPSVNPRNSSDILAEAVKTFCLLLDPTDCPVPKPNKFGLLLIEV